ncbi:unnamed protein product [Heligmosomoides polygyrus]|uniref:Uncharacterized protein n=1 Tax=Heligmosomoides polygyrus TaxID=6339 RepID=A0A183FHE3_HELPZ|nr:unnamed protein product [Heligmosomoides polygyrus]
MVSGRLENLREGEYGRPEKQVEGSTGGRKPRTGRSRALEAPELLMGREESVGSFKDTEFSFVAEQESRTQTELLREKVWPSDRVVHWREMLGEAGFRVDGTMEWNDDGGYDDSAAGY